MRKVLILALLAFGCGDDCASSSEPSSNAESSGEQASEHEGSGETTANGESEAAEQLAEGIAAAAEATESSREAAEASADAPADPCPAAYDALVAMRTAIQQRLGSGGQAQMPDRDTYLDACNALPEGAQRCMSIQYSSAHRDECQRAMAAVPPEAQQRMRAASNPGLEQR